MDEQVCMSKENRGYSSACKEKINYAHFHNQGCVYFFSALFNHYLDPCIFFQNVSFFVQRIKSPSYQKAVQEKYLALRSTEREEEAEKAAAAKKKSRNFDMTAFDSRLKTNGRTGAPPPKPLSLPKFEHSNCHFADLKVDFAPL